MAGFVVERAGLPAAVYGKAGHSGVQNNEFIVFDSRQHRLRYLAEFTVA